MRIKRLNRSIVPCAILCAIAAVSLEQPLIAAPAGLHIRIADDVALVQAAPSTSATPSAPQPADGKPVARDANQPAANGNPAPTAGSTINLVPAPPATGPAPTNTHEALQELLQQSALIQVSLTIFFGLVCLVLQAILLAKAKASPDAVLRNVTVTLVATLSIAVVMVGYTNQAISPVVGLFGTIIGFLLGQQQQIRRDAPAAAPPVAAPPTGQAPPQPPMPAQPEPPMPAEPQPPAAVQPQPPAQPGPPAGKQA